MYNHAINVTLLKLKEYFMNNNFMENIIFLSKQNEYLHRLQPNIILNIDVLLG